MKYLEPQYQTSEFLFPDVSLANKDGILCISYDISVEMLLNAYSHGIFPWPIDDSLIPWSAPKQRGILNIDSMHISKRLLRHFKKSKFQFRVNTNFEDVIVNCAKATRKSQTGTWITNNMIEAYIQLHKVGYAVSFETYSNNLLVGGMYGVFIGKYFAGESMFFKESNASKFAFVNACKYLKSQGLKWIDIQMVTPLTKAFGGIEINRDEFMKKLQKLSFAVGKL